MDEFITGMNTILKMPFESVMQILCTMNYILNDEKLELEDISIYEPEQKELKELLERQRSVHAFSFTPAEENQKYEHNTYPQEQLFLQLVRRGDSDALGKWIASAPAIRGGTLASDQLRQLKNTFVVAATLVSRAAIQSGLSPEAAFLLSDMYIQKWGKNLTDFILKEKTILQLPVESRRHTKLLHDFP